ncbi:hypothetical protein Hanom_Chr14g01257401 [Helianthus anomalus]
MSKKEVVSPQLRHGSSTADGCWKPYPSSLFSLCLSGTLNLHAYVFCWDKVRKVQPH